MAVTPTTRLQLNKQDSGDANWHTALNSGFDNAEARFMRFGTADPNSAEQCHYVGQIYARTGVTPTEIWVGTVVGTPGTWVQVSTTAALLNVLTANGDMLVRAAGAIAKLAIGSSGQFLRESGGAPVWTTLLGSMVGHTPTAPVTAVTAQAAIDQLSHAYSSHDKTTAQTGITTEVALTDLVNLAIPGGGNSAKVYRCSGQVSITNSSPTGYTVRVRVGPLGTAFDPIQAAAIYQKNTSGATAFQIPMRPFVPASGDKVTITFEAGASADIDNVAIRSFLIIEQISNA